MHLRRRLLCEAALGRPSTVPRRQTASEDNIKSPKSDAPVPCAEASPTTRCSASQGQLRELRGLLVLAVTPGREDLSI